MKIFRADIRLLDDGIFKDNCVLKISRSIGMISVRIEKGNHLIACGEACNLVTALKKVNASYLKLRDKYAAQMARFELITSNIMYDDNISDYIKSGGSIKIERKSFFPYLVAQVYDYYGKQKIEKNSPDLYTSLQSLDSLLA